MKSYKKLLLKVIPFHTWRVAIRQYEKQKQEILRNVFNTPYKKHALVSYIQAPFINGIPKTHTNYTECMTAAQILRDLGYNVDVIEYDMELISKDISKYDIVFGFGKTFNIACSNPDINTIFYGTGCSLDYSNPRTLQRVIDFYNNTGVWCPEAMRYVNLDNVAINKFTKHIICVGNEFVKSTYDMVTDVQKTKNLNLFYFDAYDPDINRKDFDVIKKNFLYFGSTGGLHKGLDFVIDLFKCRPDINLTICGFNPAEVNLYEHYYDVFDNKYPNIKYYPFVNIETEQFKNIMDSHIAVISPSVSEGGAPATLMCMANGGLIPVAPKTLGLDIEKYGFQFENINISEIEKCVDKILDMNTATLKKLAQCVKDETRQVYTYDNYKRNLSGLISGCLCN